MNYNNFKKIRMYGWRVWLCRNFYQSGASGLVEGIDGRRSDFLKVPSSAFANVFKCRLSFKDTIHNVYLKQYLHRSWLDFVKHLFRNSRGMRDFRASLMLQRNGFNTPDLIAIGEKRLGPCCMKTFLITNELTGARPIHQIVANLGRDSSEQGEAERKKFILSFGQTVGKMHNAGIFHGDLRLGNILAEKSENGWEFFFLDNERTKKYSRIPTKLRRKNLVQLNMIGNSVTDRDRLRFFASYTAKNRSMQSKEKELVLAVMKKTAKRKSC